MRKMLMSYLLLPSLAFSAPVSFNFNAVSLKDFTQATLSSLLHADYVISPEVLAMDRKVTMSVASVDEAKVGDFVEGILKQQGVAIDVRDGVYYLIPSRMLAPALIPDSGQRADVQPRISATPLLSDDVPKERGFGLRSKDDESELYSPQNRPSDFLVAVVVAAFGARSASAVGADILLTGSKADIEKMRKVLESVDSLPKLVDVSASWIEVTDNASDGRGISLMANFLGAKLGASLGIVNSGSAVSIKSSRFELVIDALKSDTRFKQVSNSRLVGDDYEKIMLTVGDETPTVSSTGRDNAGNTVQNIVYRPSGVIVDVLPKVLGNGRIKLAVDGQISNFKSTSNGVTSSPTLIKRQVKTQVTVVDGEVLLIGGLNDRQSSNTSSSLSFWPSWASKSNTNAETDLVLVLSAKVVKQ
nr:hypothetical protein [uncultured Duganella sp.]